MLTSPLKDIIAALDLSGSLQDQLGRIPQVLIDRIVNDGADEELLYLGVRMHTQALPGVVPKLILGGPDANFTKGLGQDLINCLPVVLVTAGMERRGYLICKNWPATIEEAVTRKGSNPEC